MKKLALKAANIVFWFFGILVCVVSLFVAQIEGAETISYTIAVGTGCLLIARILPGTTNKTATREKHAPRNIFRNARRISRKLHEEDSRWTGSDGEIHTREWRTFKFEPDPNKKSPKWTAIPELAELNVAGTSYHQEECQEFFNTASNRTATASIEWDEQAPPALRVSLHATPDCKGLFVGYVPSEATQIIRDTYDPTMPIGARLKRAGIHCNATRNAQKKYFFSLAIVGPPKNKRETFRLKGD